MLSEGNAGTSDFTVVLSRNRFSNAYSGIKSYDQEAMQHPLILTLFVGMKLFSVEVIQQWDRITMQRQGISSLALMERAAYALWCAMKTDIPKGTSVGLLCGPGNNGGDGLALARIMQQEGINTKVYLYGTQQSADQKHNLALYKKLWPHRMECLDLSSLGDLKHDIIIDALFGSGLNRPMEEDLSQINRTGIPVWSIDLPSGMPGAWPKNPDERNSFIQKSIRAQRTFTLQQPKPSFFHEAGYALCNKWTVVDIGLDMKYYNETESDIVWLRPKDFLPLIPRKRFAHKGDFGHGCLLAGSVGKSGAVVMAAEASLSSGIGLLTLWVPEAIQDIVQISVPQAMTEVMGTEESELTLAKFVAFAAGPGMGLNVQSTFLALLKHCKSQAIPILLDADALNILANNPEWMHLLGPHTILTPHPGELDRLCSNKDKDEFVRLQLALQFCSIHECYLLLKRSYSILCTPEGKQFVCSNGSPSLAKAGSGDVLTGILLALLAQGMNIQQAGCTALLAHALCGESVESSKGTHAATYRDLLNCLPGVLSTS